MRISFAIILILLCETLQAQQVQTLVMSGPDKTDFQTVIVQPLDDDGNFTFTSLAFFQRYHDKNNQPFDELGVQGSAFWNISRSISIGPGLYYNHPKGLMPKMLFQIFHSVGPLTFLANPAIYHHENGYWGGEIFVQATYIRSMAEHVALFAQANVLTTWDRFEDHGRSFIQLRLGPRFSKGLQFGLAYDADWYSPAKISKTSIGVFISQWF